MAAPAPADEGEMGVADAVQAGEPLHLGLRVPLDADEIAGAAQASQGLDGDGVDRQAVAHEARKGRIGLRPNERLGVPPEGRVKAFRLQDQPVPGDDRKPVEARAGRAQAGGVELQGFQGVHEFSETLVDHAPELCRLPLGRVLMAPSLVHMIVAKTTASVAANRIAVGQTSLNSKAPCDWRLRRETRDMPSQRPSGRRTI